MKKISREEYYEIIKSKIIELKDFNESEADRINLDEYIDYNGIGLDSLQLLTLLVCLEEECGFELSDTDLSLTQFTQIKDLVNIIYNKCSGGEE